MIVQETFKNNNHSLFIVPTPIGNLEDFSSRAIKTLSTSDLIFCEDTRVSSLLLSKFNIKKKLIALHDFNEASLLEKTIELLKTNKKVSLISDAGVPLISDPGFLLVEKAIENGFNVTSLSAGSAFLTCLVASGLKSDIFTFYGFIPKKESEFISLLDSLKFLSNTLIFYDSPKRIIKNLEIIVKIFGERKICIGRELTKINETFYRGSFEEVINILKKKEVKGEVVLIIEGNNVSKSYSDEEILTFLLNDLKITNNINLTIDNTRDTLYINKNKIKELYFNYQKENKNV